MAKDQSAQIRNDKRYEELRKKGMSKEKAARIANASADSRRNPPSKGGRNPAYEAWPKDRLYRRAREIGIAGRSRMGKTELIRAIRGH